MTRLLCWIGLHTWALVESVGFYKVLRRCDRCRKEDVIDLFP